MFICSQDGSRIGCPVRVVARSTLTKFVQNRVPRGQRRLVAEHLEAWHKLVKRVHWASSAELKEDLRSASVISAQRVVFNIKGNEYRLVAGINYQRQSIFIKWLGTHAEYDKIDVATVQHEEERYGNLSNSK
jgi:mRNA interferase HigB